MWWSWGTIKRLAARVSLQRTIHNQILNQHQLYDFAKSEIPGITCFFIDVVSKFWTSRYENARPFRGGRKNHQFISNDGNVLMSRISEVEFSSIKFDWRFSSINKYWRSNTANVICLLLRKQLVLLNSKLCFNWE